MADKTSINIDVKVNSGSAETKIKNLQSNIDKTGSKGVAAGNKINKGLNQGGTGASNAKKKVNELGGGLDNAGQKGDGAGQKIAGGMNAANVAAASATIALVAVGKALATASEKAQEFEYSMAKVNAVAIGTNDKLSEIEKQEAFKLLSDDALRLGSETAKTSMEVASLQLEFAKLGFSAEEIVGATEATLNLSIAMGEDLAQSAVVSGSTLRGFGLDAEETSRVTDVMAKSFSSSALDLTKFQESMKVIAPIANAAGFELEETTAILAKLADAGIHGSLAGTSLKNILSKMMDPTSKLNKLFFNQVKTFDDLVIRMQELKESNFDLGEASSFLDERSKAAFLTLVQGSDGLGELKNAFDNAEGSADRMRKIMENTAQGSMDKLNSATEGLYIKIGEQLNPALIQTRLALADWIGGIDTEEIKAYFTGIGVSVSIASIAFMKLKWSVIAASTAFKVLRTAMITSGIGAIVVLLGTGIGLLLDWMDVFESSESNANASGSARAIEAIKTQNLVEAEERLAAAKRDTNDAYDESNIDDLNDQLAQAYKMRKIARLAKIISEEYAAVYIRQINGVADTLEGIEKDQKIANITENFFKYQKIDVQNGINGLNVAIDEYEEAQRLYEDKGYDALDRTQKQMVDQGENYEYAGKKISKYRTDLLKYLAVLKLLNEQEKAAQGDLRNVTFETTQYNELIQAIKNEIKFQDNLKKTKTEGQQAQDNLNKSYDAYKEKQETKIQKQIEELALQVAYKKGIKDLSITQKEEIEKQIKDYLKLGLTQKEIFEKFGLIRKKLADNKYEVQAGESLDVLAKKFKKEGETLEQAKQRLIEYNKELLKTWSIKGQDVQGFDAGAVITTDTADDDDQITADAKLEIQRAFDDELNSMRAQTFSMYKDSLAEEVKAYKKAGIAQNKIDKWVNKKKAQYIFASAKAGVDSVAQSTAIMAKAGMIGAKTARDIARVQATMDAIASANAAYKAMAGIPVVGPALGAAAAAAALAAGYANVQAIESSQFQPPEAEVPEMEEPEIQWENKGGYIDPRLGSGTKDDVPAMLTAGEYVIKRESTDILGPELLKDINQNPQKYTTFRNAGGFVGYNPVSFPKGGMTSLGKIGQAWVSGLPAAPTMKPNFNLDKHNDSASFNAGGAVKKRKYYEYGGVVSPPSTMLGSIQNTSDILADPTLSSAQPVDLDDITPAPPAQQITIGSVMTNEQYYRNVLKPIADRTERYEL